MTGLFVRPCLKVVQFRVQASRSHQNLVPAALHKHAIVQGDDRVRHAHHRQFGNRLDGVWKETEKVACRHTELEALRHPAPMTTMS